MSDITLCKDLILPMCQAEDPGATFDKSKIEDACKRFLDSYNTKRALKYNSMRDVITKQILWQRVCKWAKVPKPVKFEVPNEVPFVILILAGAIALCDGPVPAGDFVALGLIGLFQ